MQNGGEKQAVSRTEKMNKKKRRDFKNQETGRQGTSQIRICDYYAAGDGAQQCPSRRDGEGGSSSGQIWALKALSGEEVPGG
jgi:hypothetical protein